MRQSLVLITILICFHLSHPIRATLIDCKHRNYGHDSTVCVCNEFHCDLLGSSSRPVEKGTVISYETSKSGLRFAQKTISFLNETQCEHSNDIVRINIDRSKHYQKIIGFGGAFTDAAGINIAKLPENMQERLIRDYFGDDGLEYTIGRVPIGGSDFSTRPYTYDDNPNDEKLTKFQLQPEDLLYKMAYMHKAIEVSSKPIKFFGSPWSPPAWMKTNNEINHGGFLKDNPGEKYYQIWANYIIKFLDEYTRHNLTMWGLTVQNEPSMGYRPDFQFNSLGLNSSMERDFIKLDLGPSLEAAGYGLDKLKLMIIDDNMWTLKEFAHTILSDPEAARYVSGIAFHWYSNTNYTERIELDITHEHFPDFFLLSTEACEMWVNHSQHVYLGDWNLFRSYADDIMKDLIHNSAGWVDWNLALDTIGGPNWVDNFVDAAIIVNATAKEYYKQPTYYALGHFSKFLKEGSQRLKQTMIGLVNEHVQAVTFQRLDGAIVLIALNTDQLNGYDVEIYDVPHGRLHLHLQADSMQTLIWSD